MDAKKAASADRQNETTEIDLATAKSFLQALDLDGTFTFQTFGDSRKDPALLQVLNGTFDQHQDELSRLNNQGSGVFVTINKTDLKGRKSENIKAIRAVFLDLDGAPLPEEWGLEPHLIVESSPGRWHAYWLAYPGFPLEKFEATQKAIAVRFGGDPSIIDLPRVMRLPGFIHQKKIPFRSRILRDWGQEPRYSHLDILKAFPPAPNDSKGSRPHTDDPILKILAERGLVIRADRQDKGKFIIQCPWAASHSNGIIEAAYWLPNHGGFQGPGFKCLHGHCTDRTVSDLSNFLGLQKGDPATPHILIKKISEIETKPVEWLWPGYLPKGALCLIDGDPGLGKSFFTLDLAARVSAGKVFPTGERATPGGVVLLSYEDDPGYTIRPRLEVMGGDLERIVLLNSVFDERNQPRLPHVGDIRAIREAVESIGTSLIIVDPLMAALPVSTDSHSDQNIRSVLAPLSKLAQETGSTILVVRHLNKSSGGNALYRGGGSIGIVAASRAAFLVAKDPHDETRRILAVSKMNIAPEPDSLAYRIATNPEGCPFLSWEGKSDLTAKDLLQTDDKPRNAPKKGEAVAWLENRLKGGPVESETLFSEGAEHDISPKTLKRAKKEMGIISFREGGADGSWFWDLKRANPSYEMLLTPFNNNGVNTGDFKEGQLPGERSFNGVDPLYRDQQTRAFFKGGHQVLERAHGPLSEDDNLPVEDI